MNTPATTLSAAAIKRELRHHAAPERAKAQSYFYKTSKGAYGAGMRFLGVTVPVQRQIARRYRDTGKAELSKLLDSGLHEHRLTALLILVRQYEASRNEKDRGAVYRFYMKHIKSVNNWDLVDASSYKIVGAWLYDYQLDRSVLYKLARSKDLWKNRISIISTLYFIKNQDFETSLDIATILIDHPHDLIHKAVGWMLREIGKFDEALMLSFIEEHYEHMPRTTLRYAIEKLPEAHRQRVLKGGI